MESANVLDLLTEKFRSAIEATQTIETLKLSLDQAQKKLDEISSLVSELTKPAETTSFSDKAAETTSSLEQLSHDNSTRLTDLEKRIDELTFHRMQSTVEHKKLKERNRKVENELSILTERVKYLSDNCEKLDVQLHSKYTNVALSADHDDEINNSGSDENDTNQLQQEQTNHLIFDQSILERIHFNTEMIQSVKSNLILQTSKSDNLSERFDDLQAILMTLQNESKPSSTKMQEAIKLNKEVTLTNESTVLSDQIQTLLSLQSDCLRCKEALSSSLQEKNIQDNSSSLAAAKMVFALNAMLVSLSYTDTLQTNSIKIGRKQFNRLLLQAYPTIHAVVVQVNELENTKANTTMAISVDMKTELQSLCQRTIELLESAIEKTDILDQLNQMKIAVDQTISADKIKTQLDSIQSILCRKVDTSYLDSVIPTLATQTDLKQIWTQMPTELIFNQSSLLQSNYIVEKYQMLLDEYKLKIDSRFGSLKNEWNDHKFDSNKYVQREEVFEAMTKIVTQFQQMESDSVSRKEFDECLRVKADDIQVQKLVQALQAAMGNLESRTDTSVGYLRCLTCDRPTNAITSAQISARAGEIASTNSTENSRIVPDKSNGRVPTIQSQNIITSVRQSSLTAATEEDSFTLPKDQKPGKGQGQGHMEQPKTTRLYRPKSADQADSGKQQKLLRRLIANESSTISKPNVVLARMSSLKSMNDDSTVFSNVDDQGVVVEDNRLNSRFLLQSRPQTSHVGYIQPSNKAVMGDLPRLLGFPSDSKVTMRMANERLRTNAGGGFSSYNHAGKNRFPA